MIGPHLHLTPVFILLATLGPLALVAITLGGLGIVTYHRRAVHKRQVGSELIRAMLERDLSVDEIERVIAAWADDRRLARKLLASHVTTKPKFAA